MENIVDPDQLASLEASWSGSTLFSIEFIYDTELLRTELNFLFFETSKIFFGQVHYGHLLVLGQVWNLDISTPLILWLLDYFRADVWSPCSRYGGAGSGKIHIHVWCAGKSLIIFCLEAQISLDEGVEFSIRIGACN